MRTDLLSDERGSQTIEFLLVIPALMIMVLCLGEFGTAAIHKISLESAARDGAHLAALHAAPAEIEAAVTKAAGSVPISEIAINQQDEGTVTLKVVSELELKLLGKFGLPLAYRILRIEAESKVPLVDKHG